MAIDVKSAFQQLATDKRAIQSVKDIAVKKYTTPTVDDIFTVIPNIKGGQQVAAMKGIEYVTTKEDGCGGTSLNPTFPALSQEWNPRRAKIKIKMCYTDFEQYFTQWGLGNGYDVHNLEESDFFDFIVDLTTDAMRKDTTRIVLLGDKDIATQNILNDANKVKFYDIIDKGLISTLQYFKTIPELSDNFVSISQNSAASAALQMTFGEADAFNLFYDLTEEADFDGNQLLSSGKLAANYKKYLRAWQLESSKEQIQKGMPDLIVNGERLAIVKDYDRWRKNDFKAVASPNLTQLPHFALFSAKESLQVGVDSAQALEDLRFEYVGGDDEHIYIKGNYMIDFKMVNPYDFRAAL
ncbi:hypothetical protein [Epilithonimonas sp. UC225_85]|uniref:hypothetical protein n=1 Tax=Epilithonimonas sp. UC225_85 TaxID=3350167 RepID=UPI0036D32EDE